jgi:hypothetical protein
VVHWRYPNVDIGYAQGKLVDEYYTIYPDGTMVRCVSNPSQSFQDTQILLSPGQGPLDVLNLQANTLMNLSGEIQELTYTIPKGMPLSTLPNSWVELLNTKSTYKPYLIFTGGKINTWGVKEASPYSDLPFAGPWDHYPISLDPSDGRNSADNTRLRHFAGFGANDLAPSQVIYGLTNTPIPGLLNLAKMFNYPPKVSMERGAISSGFNTGDKSFGFTANASNITFTINASENTPLVNPCFVIRNWGSRSSLAELKVNDMTQTAGPNFRQGVTIDSDGTYTLIVWVGISADTPQNFEISKK